MPAAEDKSTRYHRLRRQSDVAGTAAAGLVLASLILTGLAVPLRQWAEALTGGQPASMLTVGVTAVALFLLLQFVELPFAFYQGFLLEHRYGLSTQSFGHWVADQVKGLGVGLVIGVAGAEVVFAALRLSPERWWAWSAVAFILGMVGLTRLAPVLLLPLFYQFKPLERPALTARLMALAASARTEVMGVFEWVLSGHTKKANAALAGMGRTRRILLSDTLLADYSDDEIEVVLAHELAHHVHHDLWRAVALQAALIAGGFWVLHRATLALAGPLGAAGAADAALLPLWLLVAGAWSLATLPLVNALSRANERAADRYAIATTGRVDAFVSAMKRLAQQNMAEEDPSALVRAVFHSHPPIRERIAAARAATRITRQTAGVTRT